MEHIKETLNSDYKFRTLTADDGYIIANVLHGFDADNYIGTKTMVLPAEREVAELLLEDFRPGYGVRLAYSLLVRLGAWHDIDLRTVAVRRPG